MLTDEIRTFTETDFDLVFVRQSQETSSSEYANSLIVVVKDNERNSETGYVVQRYWKHRETGWLLTRELFWFDDGEVLKEISIFNDFAVALFANNHLKVLYYPDEEGDEVPYWKRQLAYNFESNSLKNYLIYDASTAEEPARLILVATIQFSGTLAIQRFKLHTDPVALETSLYKRSGAAYLLSSFEISAFANSDHFLVVGCHTCSNNQG